MFRDAHCAIRFLALPLPLLVALGCSNGSRSTSSACTPWAWDGSVPDGSARTAVGGLGGLCNDPRCPATFAASRPLCYSDGSTPGGPCSMIGFQCWYPGAGDGTLDAVVECSGFWADGGSTGRWVCLQ